MVLLEGRQGWGSQGDASHSRRFPGRSWGIEEKAHGVRTAMAEKKVSVRMKAGPKTAVAVIGSAAALLAGCGDNSKSTEDTTSPTTSTTREYSTPSPTGGTAPTASTSESAPGDTMTPGGTMMPTEPGATGGVPGGPSGSAGPGGASGEVPGGPSGSAGPGGASGSIPGVGGGSVSIPTP